MDNLRAAIKNLFCYISPKDILDEKVRYKSIKQDIFIKLGNSYMKQYSDDEMRNMHSFLKNEFRWQNSKYLENIMHCRKDDDKNGFHAYAKDDDLNVFHVLAAFCHAVLTEENGVPVCQYAHLLRWRDMIVSLDEDLFTTAFLAMHDIVSGRERVDFFWQPVIGHNNVALNRLVAKGVAENHFHLKGSAPHFLLSWVSIMNRVDSVSFDKIFREYDSKKLQKNIAYESNVTHESLSNIWRQAALVRLFLYTKLTDKYLDFGKVYLTKKELLEWCKDECVSELENTLSSEKKVVLDGYLDKLREDAEEEMSNRYSERKVYELLQTPDMLVEYASIIQKNIDYLKYQDLDESFDYMLCKPYLVQNREKGVNEIISGERWFLYSLYLHIFREEEEWREYINLFYFYLVAKTHIHMELTQANMAVGFHNFLLYQNRKEDFIDGTQYEQPFLKMAVRDTIINQHICSLEARITPKDTVEQMQKTIKKSDKSICAEFVKEDGTPDIKAIKEFKEQYFYTIHFIKEADTEEEWVCRHRKKRKEVERQAKAIWELKARRLEEGKRIYGIDAASEEIVCRPEVFAQAFRYLKNFSMPKSAEDMLFNTVSGENLLRATYHAGEDFLDIVDGLRAIEEAVFYLNLNCGDRLGHALALGVDIDEWYEKKGYRILINKQDYLDNLVWLYARIRKMNIQNCEAAVHYIEKRFDEYFGEIYRSNISTAECEAVAQSAAKYFEERKITHGYGWNHFSFGINEYYDAWKLRGDNPELYREGFFKPNSIALDEWDYHGVNRVYPANYRIRYNPATAFLYYTYHYNEEVKKVGRETVEIKQSECMIEAIKMVRKAMQREVARLGIGIETNPSSNYLIGNFRRYDKHPIVQWYNAGLTYDKEELDECAQLQVSVNTDDQGVFSTSLENEYAYLAIALEKCKDEYGNCKYPRSFVLEWLDSIRKMGISQSFKFVEQKDFRD